MTHSHPLTEGCSDVCETKRCRHPHNGSLKRGGVPPLTVVETWLLLHRSLPSSLSKQHQATGACAKLPPLCIYRTKKGAVSLSLLQALNLSLIETTPSDHHHHRSGRTALGSVRFPKKKPGAQPIFFCHIHVMSCSWQWVGR